MEQLIHQHAKSQAEQAEAWEQERTTIRNEVESLRANLKAEKEKEIEKGKLLSSSLLQKTSPPLPIPLFYIYSYLQVTNSDSCFFCPI